MEFRWIYNFSDYQKIYNLQSDDFNKRIFDFPAGVASFNAEATQKKINVHSGDSIYQLSPAEMKQYVNHLLNNSIAQLCDTENYEHVIQSWQKAASFFLQDYSIGRSLQRYQFAELPVLPYDNNRFDLALCSNLLFHQSVLSKFPLMQIVEELTRIAVEVRFFPLLDKHGEITELLGPLMLCLQQKNYGVEIRETSCTLQKGGNAMLRVWAQECVISD